MSLETVWQSLNSQPMDHPHATHLTMGPEPSITVITAAEQCTYDLDFLQLLRVIRLGDTFC